MLNVAFFFNIARGNAQAFRPEELGDLANNRSGLGTNLTQLMSILHKESGISALVNGR